MAQPVLDRATARALTEAGYMPLAAYIAMFGESEDRAGGARDEDPHHCEATLVPDGCDDPHDAVERRPRPARPLTAS
jgi:hypothetical protein